MAHLTGKLTKVRTLPKLTKSLKTRCFRRVSGQVGLPKFTNTYHLNRKQNGNIVLVDLGKIFSHYTQFMVQLFDVSACSHKIAAYYAVPILGVVERKDGLVETTVVR